MRRLTAWIGGIVSGIVAYRFWRRHRKDEAGAVPEAAAEADARAEELRARLAESRAAEPAVEEPPPPAPESAVEEPPVEAGEQESPEERRRRVHDEGRSAVDEMQSE